MIENCFAKNVFLCVNFALVQYMFAALADCVAPIKMSQHMESPSMLLEAFDKEINQQFKEVSEI